MGTKKLDALDCRVNGRVPSHLSGDDMMDNVRQSYYGEREIDDATAVTIASNWQSPGTIGRVLAQLASTGQCDVQALLDDIAATRKDAGVRTSHDDKRAMMFDMLATWAINHPSREVSDG